MCEVSELHSRWSGRVVALAGRILGDRDDAQEVAQDVFIEVWRRLPQYDAARGSEWAWLRTITQSRCFDRLRAARRQVRLKERARLEEVALEPSSGEEVFVNELLARLPAAQRALLELAFVEGCTHREIALRTGQPLGTVKTRIRLGLQRLASILQPEGPALLSAAGGRSR